VGSTNRIEVQEKNIIDIMEEEHSKTYLQIPFRTDIDRAIYS